MNLKGLKMFGKIIKTAALAGILTGAVQAAEIEVKIVNNTGASFFTPLLVATHAHSTQLFKAGTEASASLQAMAEGGNIAGLVADLSDADAEIISDPAGGLLAPGTNAVATLNTDNNNDSLSLVAMILPTNDGFIALNNWKVPETPGVYKVMLNAYDAGTEGNDEIINGGGAPGTAGIPGDPSGKGGTGATGIPGVSVEGFVHIHRGILGDTDKTGGHSDLDAANHRWLNPVATAIITVK
jgi:hypothetical protein